MQENSSIAAVDLGSNSFRLQVARLVDDQLYMLDSLREPVRLAAGLLPDGSLDEAAKERALDCLARFAERLRGIPPEDIRAVGTNTLRLAHNAGDFVTRAEKILGVPIEVISGREEARLIYIGVAHSLPPNTQKRLVIDIGGGSTELIIGAGFKPRRMESVNIGCVSFSARYFAEGKISKSALHQAEVKARLEIQAIGSEFSPAHWQEAVGSSGTVRAVSEILEQNQWSERGITPEGLAQLRSVLLEVGDANRLDLLGLKAERKSVLPGGFAILSAIFSELGIKRLTAANGALREGVLYDLVGRFQHRDMRDTTINQFARRYHCDLPQAARVEKLSLKLFKQLMPNARPIILKHLAWAARLHEAGISIAHSGYHRHSAYILQNADMPGFSEWDQTHLALLVRCQRGSLKIEGLILKDDNRLLILALRLAVLFYRSRVEAPLSEIILAVNEEGFTLQLEQSWIDKNPLSEAALLEEARRWQDIGVNFRLFAKNLPTDSKQTLESGPQA